MSNHSTTEMAPGSDPIQCRASDGFQQWLAQAGGTVVLTTYQSGKVALIGWNGQQMSVLLRDFPKPMGVAVQGHRLALATHHQVWQFANAPDLAYAYLEAQPGRYDALYLPRVAHCTGDLHIHDVGFVEDELWVVNTRFSCLSSLSADFSFVPRWQPSFISELAPEDRCHLNGLAIAHNEPRYVTALGESDTVGGWRANRASGGIVIDVRTHEIILRGLSMPHSPHWHGDRLWLLNSGAGELWQVNPETDQHSLICVIPGFLRGLCCVGSYALIGLSQIRERHIFGDLPVQARFPQLICGLAIVDLTRGETIGLLEFTTGCQEIGDVAFLPGITRANILNLDKPATRQAFTAPDFSYWLRPSNQISDPPPVPSLPLSSTHD